jgi:hypothetical protein
MLKIIWISDKEKKQLLHLLLKKLCNETFYKVNGGEAEKIIESEAADFLYLNLLKPANTDVMHRLCLRNINRLRVSVFEVKPIKSRIMKFLFPPDIIRTIAFNMFYFPSSDKYKNK